MRQRLLIGPILIAALVGLIVADGWITGSVLSLSGRSIVVPPGVVVLLICCLTAVLGAAELSLILRSKSIFAPAWLLMLAAVLGLSAVSVPVMLAKQTGPLATGVTPVDPAYVPSAAAILLICGVLALSRGHTTKGVAAGLGGVFLSFIYLGVIFAFAVLLRIEHHPALLLWTLLITKSCDIGAYFTGKAIGRHKLIPWLSPGKTWEGLIGGMVLAAGVGAGGAIFLKSVLGVAAPSAPAAAGASLLFAAIGQAGDLTASLLKRDAGIKDSGKLLPGFGGILDIVDSPLLVMPFAHWWLAYATAS